jgi:hypothetical protein
VRSRNGHFGTVPLSRDYRAAGEKQLSVVKLAACRVTPSPCSRHGNGGAVLGRPRFSQLIHTLLNFADRLNNASAKAALAKRKRVNQIAFLSGVVVGRIIGAPSDRGTSDVPWA